MKSEFLFLRHASAGRRYILGVWLASSLLLLAGCVEQRIRTEADSRLAGGDYARAVGVLEEGLKDHPDSTILRSGLIQARSEAIARLVERSANLRANGKPDEAISELKKALELDPKNERVKGLLSDIALEQRQTLALAKANEMVEKKRPDLALKLIEQALKDNPRNPALLSLQRRLEIEQRQAQIRDSESVLAETRPITLDFRDAGLRSVLDVISRNAGINFIIDKDVRADARITVLIRQAKLEDALDLIVGSNQLAKKVLDSKTIIIYPNTAEKQREYQEQVVRVFYLASADAKGAAAFLKQMLKIRDPFVDERSNMLSMRDSPENIQLAERLIALYDAGEPEVLLDVQVLEVSSSRLTELGIKFPSSFSLTVNPPGTDAALTLANLRSVGKGQVQVGISPITVNLNRQVGDFETLANPKIRARNKEKAKILIGDKIPVISATTGQQGFVSDTVTYLDVGIKLDVEPTVYADDDVAIKIALEVSSLGTAVKTQSGTLAYQIGTRNASTLLRLHDGETQMLGGLISRDDRTSASRVPGIGDLPLLGRLFSSQSDDSQRTELVLAITPHILRNIRRPDATETELWVGTEAFPKLRPVGGLRASAVAPDRPVGAQQAATAVASVRPGEPVPEPAKAAAAIALKWAGPAEVKAGEPFDVKLSINSGALLRGLPIEFAFPQDRLQLVDVQEGEFFKQGGATTSISRATDVAGRGRVGILRNEASGASGEGTVLSVRLKAFGAGPVELRMMSAQGIGLGAAPPAIDLPPPLVLQVH
jgi:general secretion pathway protein D